VQFNLMCNYFRYGW